MIHTCAFCDCCGATSRPLEAKSIKGGLKEVIKHWVFTTVAMEPDGELHEHLFCTSCAEVLGLLVACPGEAHQVIKNGGDQDHCMVCLPRWGVVEADPMPQLTWADLRAGIKKVHERERVIEERHKLYQFQAFMQTQEFHDLMGATIA